MARLPRIVVPGLPHHVTQRGNRRQPVFFHDDDYLLYCETLAEQCAASDVAVWSYCLMPNHIHLVLVPTTDDGLARAIGGTHRRYSAYINTRLRVTGHLFQGRFGSVAMNEVHLLAAFRYVAMNPVKAGLVASADAWRWSSTRAHLAGVSDTLVDVRPLLERVDNIDEFLDNAPDVALERRLDEGATVGRPLVDDTELAALETRLNQRLRPAKRGRPKKPSATG